MQAYSGPLAGRLVPVADGEGLIPNTRVVHTPGHTPGHASILWSPPDRSVRVAVAGDAIINLSWLYSGYVWKFNADFAGVETAKESARRLLKMADIITPGHGEC